jgi:hypothetical protein
MTREPDTWEYHFEDHIKNDLICDWCFFDDYPQKHDCGGLLHRQYEDDDGVNCYFIRCDRCGYEDEE